MVRAQAAGGGVLAVLQPGDVADTEADTSDTREAIGYAPSTPVEEGVGRFVDWYLDYFKADLAPFPTVKRIVDEVSKIDAFARAHPLKQPGAPASV